MRSRRRIAIVQSRMRGPSGEKVVSDQLVTALREHVEACEYFVTDGYPNGSSPVLSEHSLERIRQFAPDVLIVFSVWVPRLDVDCAQIYLHVNMWRGGHDHGGSPEDLAALGYDLYLTNSREAESVLRSTGCHARYWPLFADPHTFKPAPPVEDYRCDVAYLGGNMSFKTPEAVARYLEPCAEFDFQLYGLDWDKHPSLRRFARGVLPDGRIHELYSSARIVIGFNAPSQSRWGMVNNRVFEVLSCGGCLLSDRLPEIEREFSGACAFTDGYSDTPEQIRRLLADPEERSRMGRLGRELVMQRHTVSQRVEVLLEEIEKLPPFWRQPHGGTSDEAEPGVTDGARRSMPAMYVKHHTLRDGLAETMLANPWLTGRFQIVDLTEPFGTPVGPAMWRSVRPHGAVGLVWGMQKYGAAEFVRHAREIGLPVAFMERSPLLLGGRKAFYVDPYGTTDHGMLCKPGFTEWLFARPLGLDARERLEAYRESCRGASSGVDTQTTAYESRASILRRLGLPPDGAVLFVPLQVDDDMTIIDQRSSPFVRSMEQFVALIVKNADHLPDGYHVIVKEHPANIRYAKELKHGFSHPRVTFIRDEMNVNALTQQCDAIFCVNSGVGMEGLVFHKPLISCGNSFYSGKRINRDVRTEEEVRNAFRELGTWTADRERIDRFIAYFLFDYSYDLTDPTDSQRLAGRLHDIAVVGKTPSRALAPMLHAAAGFAA